MRKGRSIYTITHTYTTAHILCIYHTHNVHISIDLIKVLDL